MRYEEAIPVVAALSHAEKVLGAPNHKLRSELCDESDPGEGRGES